MNNKEKPRDYFKQFQCYANKVIFSWNANERWNKNDEWDIKDIIEGVIFDTNEDAQQFNLDKTTQSNDIGFENWTRFDSWEEAEEWLME
jgi:hypothetical protein